MNTLRGTVSRPKKSVEASCTRCGGNGTFAHYGTCFRCGGSGKDPSEKLWIHPAEWSDEKITEWHEKREAANQKRRVSAEIKRFAKREEQFAANVEQLPELLNREEVKEDFLDLITQYKIKQGLQFDDYGDCLQGHKAEQAFNQFRRDNDPYHPILDDLFFKAYEFLLSKKQCDLFRSVSEQWAKKQEERQARRESSSHQGVIGEKLEVTAKVTFTKECFNDWGCTNLIKAIDEHGNVFITFYSGSAYIPEEGETVLIKGQVKDHDEYNYLPQTVLTRCKFLSEQEAVA